MPSLRLPLSRQVGSGRSSNWCCIRCFMHSRSNLLSHLNSLATFYHRSTRKYFSSACKQYALDGWRESIMANSNANYLIRPRAKFNYTHITKLNFNLLIRNGRNHRHLLLMKMLQSLVVVLSHPNEMHSAINLLTNFINLICSSIFN